MTSTIYFNAINGAEIGYCEIEYTNSFTLELEQDRICYYADNNSSEKEAIIVVQDVDIDPFFAGITQGSAYEEGVDITVPEYVIGTSYTFNDKNDTYEFFIIYHPIGIFYGEDLIATVGYTGDATLQCKDLMMRDDIRIKVRKSLNLKELILNSGDYTVGQNSFIPDSHLDGFSNVEIDIYVEPPSLEEYDKDIFISYPEEQ